MTETQVLVVDDELQIRRVLRMTLADYRYGVMEARNGQEALELLRTQRFDVILLDINMPGMSGIETARAARSTTDAVIIMLTVSNSEAEKVSALDAGADDYITKPFSFPELLARIRAGLRRTALAGEALPRTIQLADAAIDLQTRSVTRGGIISHLTPKEFDLLSYFITHANRAVTHRELLQSVWGQDYGDQVEYLRVFVRQLRKKIEKDPNRPRFLLTEPWLGYRFHLAER